MTRNMLIQTDGYWWLFSLFCRLTQFPIPMVVSSGGGLHIYWVMAEEIAQENGSRPPPNSSSSRTITD